jgi:hypothetical protein
MNRRAVIWQVVAALYILVNVGGAGFAVAGAEWLHALVHVGLLVVGAGPLGGLAERARRREPASLPLDDARLANLQQSIDAIAIEVERIGEAQRFNAKLQQERVRTPR